MVIIINELSIFIDIYSGATVILFNLVFIQFFHQFYVTH